MIKKHSPGPFRCSKVGSGEWDVFDANGVVIAYVGSMASGTQPEGNIALLVASPDLEVMLAETIGMLSALLDDRSPLPAAARSVLRKQHDDALKLLHRIAHGVTT